MTVYLCGAVAWSFDRPEKCELAHVTFGDHAQYRLAHLTRNLKLAGRGGRYFSR